MVAYCTSSDPIEIDDLRSNVKVTVLQNHFFLHIFLLTCLISALLCLIKIKFGLFLNPLVGMACQIFYSHLGRENGENLHFVGCVCLKDHIFATNAWISLK